MKLPTANQFAIVWACEVLIRIPYTEDGNLESYLLGELSKHAR